MAKGGLHPGAPGDQPVLRLQLEEGETEADKERLEREHRNHFFKHINSIPGADPAVMPRIEWVDSTTLGD